MLRRRSIMSIAPTFQEYLTAENIKYDVIWHEPTMSSTRTAEACQISEDCLAKGVVLRRDRDGGYLLAVLPASHHVRLSDLSDELGEDVGNGQGSRGRPSVLGLRAWCSPSRRPMLRTACGRRRQYRCRAADLYGGRRSQDAALCSSCSVCAHDSRSTAWPLQRRLPESE